VPFRVHVDAFGASTQERPSMHVLAIGISDYSKKEWRLNLAAKDAQAFGKAMTASGKGLFSAVHVTVVLDAEATIGGIERAFAGIAQRPDLKPTDVFVLYLAGHGRYADGRYYFIQHDLNTDLPPSGKGHLIKDDAVSQEMLQKLIASVQVDKRLIVLDTCESAEGAGLIRALASPRLTAMEQLQYATGDNLIAAAGQAAFESNRLGHGLLTYAILEAMSKGAGNAGEKITIDMLANHATERVPVLSREIFGQDQWPIRKLSAGIPFPIGLRQAELAVAAAVSAPLHRNYVLMRPERVRPEPRVDSASDFTLKAPTIVDILEYNAAGDWARVQWGSGVGSGWVPTDALAKPN
jgi:hypothetical protein